MVYDFRQDQRLPRLSFFAAKDIAKGEELVYDYGLRGSDKEKYGASKICYCGSKKCKGQYIL